MRWIQLQGLYIIDHEKEFEYSIPLSLSLSLSRLYQIYLFDHTIIRSESDKSDIGDKLFEMVLQKYPFN
jgi:hypothetical protein